jgi:aminopeptidase S
LHRILEVSDARALKHLEALQKIADEHGRKRAAGTPGYDASVEYVVDVLRDIGFRVSTPTFESAGEDGEGLSVRQRNVIAQTRTGDPDQVVMIGAHLDSVSDGPGIVDNGSGVATLLEIAAQLGTDPSVPSYHHCYDVACDTIDNVNREVLNHYMRALAGTLAHFATSTDELR